MVKMNIDGEGERWWDVNESISFLVWVVEYDLVCFLRCRIMKEDEDWRDNFVLGGYDEKIENFYFKGVELIFILKVF